MAKGNYLVRGDKTTCGGVIVEGCEDHCLFGNAIAREADKVTCGIFPGMFNVVGGIENDSVHGRRMAGTLDSFSSCPCRARFIASIVDDTYEKVSSTLSSTINSQSEPEKYGQTVHKADKRTSDLTTTGKEKAYTSDVILITSTIIEKCSSYEIAGDHSAIYFDVKNDSSGPYLFDPNGSYNPYKKLENGYGQRGSGFLFSGEFANLNNFIAYQENPSDELKDKLENEWFPYKVKTVPLPVTDKEILVLKNAAIALDDGDEEPGAFSCAEWSSKLLQYVEPDIETYTLPNSLWAAVVEVRKRRLKEKDITR